MVKWKDLYEQLGIKCHYVNNLKEWYENGQWKFIMSIMWWENYLNNYVNINYDLLIGYDYL